MLKYQLLHKHHLINLYKDKNQQSQEVIFHLKIRETVHF
jgi:hypothetical protein